MLSGPPVLMTSEWKLSRVGRPLLVGTGQHPVLLAEPVSRDRDLDGLDRHVDPDLHELFAQDLAGVPSSPRLIGGPLRQQAARRARLGWAVGNWLLDAVSTVVKPPRASEDVLAREPQTLLPFQAGRISTPGVLPGGRITRFPTRIWVFRP